MPAIDRAGPVVLDAAMGTRLIAFGLDLAASDPCLWGLDRPEVVREIHQRDVVAGADALTANTFGAHRAWLDRLGRAGDVARVNRRAVELAREAAGPGRLVFGSVGPAAAEHPRDLAEQVDVLSDAGVDALLFETLRPDQAVRILSALGDGPPKLVSLFAWPMDGLADLARRLADLGAAALGVNCVLGMLSALEVVRRLAPVTGLPLLVEPSAGLPGEPPASPGSFASAVPELLALGVRFLGGCCGTNHEHVAALRRACDALIPTPAVPAAESLE